MSDADAYVALMASLPHPERLFRAKQPPLSRLRLERRLTVLTPKDREVLRCVERVLDWGAYDAGSTGALAAARYRAAMKATESETLHIVIRERVDLRTAVAGLRMRRRGEGPPAKGWSPSRLAGHISAHWTEPTFGLDLRLPGLREIGALLEAQAPLATERKLLEVAHQQLLRHAVRHHFDLEAVVLYVLRWSIFERWAEADAHAATARFNDLTDQALATFTGLAPRRAAP